MRSKCWLQRSAEGVHKAAECGSLDVTWLQPFGHAIHHKCPWRRRSWNCILSHITERTLSNHTLKSRLLCPCFPKRFFTSSSTRMPSQRRRSRRFGEALHTTCDGAACKHTEVRANGLPSKTAEFLPCNCACRHGAWVYHNGFWMLLAVSALKLAWRSLKHISETCHAMLHADMAHTHTNTDTERERER